MSLVHTQLTRKFTRSRGSCLSQIGRIFYFRRRLPKPIGGEVSLSLRTSDYREAQYLAQQLNRALERASLHEMTKQEIERVLKTVLDRCVETAWQKFASTPPPVYAYWWDESHGDPHAADLKETQSAIASTQAEIKRRSASWVEEWAEEVAQEFAVPKERLRELAFWAPQGALGGPAEPEEMASGRASCHSA
jgi:hypothetical protein